MFIFNQVALGKEMRLDWMEAAMEQARYINQEAAACFGWGC